MKQILAIIVILVLAVAGYYYYTGKKLPTSPQEAYNQIIALPNSEQAKAVQATVAGWIKDPTSAIPYPKGWTKETVTEHGQAFSVVTNDTAVPPTYYVAFDFPKSIISQEHLIKCLGTASTKATDICVVGENAEVNAYYNIVSWLQANPITGSASSATTASAAS